ncbi:MAG: repeat protein, partial [Chthonomonadales bacterium]|nr:repeat protein [Chthonomonadales bacterium]
GHGYADRGGMLHLFAYDIPPQTDTTAAGRQRLLNSSISSADLTAWLNGVDAGEFVLILDACHSGAAEEAEFKPGPMGDRGLGQLAYDKGMRILAASQAQDATIESGVIGHGVLTYALVHEGLELGEGDVSGSGSINLTQWLAYGVSRVPSLYWKVRTGHVNGKEGPLSTLKVSVELEQDSKQADPNAQHYPALFDFNKHRRAEPLLQYKKQFR